MVSLDQYLINLLRKRLIVYDDAVARGLIQTIEGPFSGEGQRGWIVAQKNS